MDPPAYHSENCIDEKMTFATLDTSYKQIDFVGTEKITLFRLLLTKASSVMASFVFVQSFEVGHRLSHCCSKISVRTQNTSKYIAKGVVLAIAQIGEQLQAKVTMTVFHCWATRYEGRMRLISVNGFAVAT